MAIAPATLTTTITENLKLNGVTYGNTIVKSTPACELATQRVMTATTGGAVLLSFATIAEVNGFVYFRLKNGDASNFIKLEMVGGLGGQLSIKLLAGESFELECNEIWSYANSVWDKITKVTVSADTADCDVEFLYVSK